MTRPLACLGLACVILLALLPPPALATAPPSSAAASATQTEEELTESESLLFVFPQRTAIGPGRLLTLDTGNSSPQPDFGASGLVLGGGAFRAFAASLNTVWDRGANVLVGGAWSNDAWRAGAAFHWLRAAESGEEDTRYDPGYNGRKTKWLSERLTTGLSAGIGGTWSSVTFDAVVHVDREELSASTEREEFSAPAQQESHMNFDRESGWGGAIRLKTRWGERTSTTVSAAFQDRSGELRGRQTYYLSVPSDFLEDHYGHSVRSAVAFERRVTDSTWVALYASYADTRGDVDLRAQFGFDVRQRRDEIRAAGASVRRPGWWDTTLYAGFRTEMQRNVTEATRLSESYLNTSRDSEESARNRFGWGASRTIGDFDLMAHMSSTLSLSSPVASLDATIRF